MFTQTVRRTTVDWCRNKPKVEQAFEAWQMMSEHLIEIEMLIRRLRGESEAMMVQANDRRFYVAKLAGNPKGTRSLVK